LAQFCRYETDLTPFTQWLSIDPVRTKNSVAKNATRMAGDRTHGKCAVDLRRLHAILAPYPKVRDRPAVPLEPPANGRIIQLSIVALPLALVAFLLNPVESRREQPPLERD
jgi:hypothetical protein